MTEIARELPAELAAPHETRPIGFLRREEVAGWQMKLYGIALHGREPRAEFVTATRDLAAAVLPQPPVADGRYGVGFATAHDAATAAIALVYWWQGANELHQRIAVAPRDDPAALALVPDQPAGCVWELEIVDFERRAWLEDVLANPAGPDLERYLERRFATEI